MHSDWCFIKYTDGERFLPSVELQVKGAAEL